MPESISLSKNSAKFKSVRDWLGAKVPWETKSYNDDVLAMESVGGVFDLSSWATLTMVGQDSIDYLQRMTTINFKTLPSRVATYGAFLTGKGTVVSLGIFIKEDSKVSYTVTEFQHARALEHIEKFHFAENFQTVDESETVALFGWWNPRKDILAELHFDESIPLGQVEWRRWKSTDLEIWKDPARSQLFFFKMNRKVAENFLVELERIGVPLIGHRVYETLRIRTGVPEFGVDLSEKEIFLESGFDLAVHRNKGCYPGQEVVERIFTYGSVNKKLQVIQVSAPNLEKITLPYELKQKDTKIGTLVSLAIDPKDPSKGWGLAYLQKEYWNKIDSFQL